MNFLLSVADRYAIFRLRIRAIIRSCVPKFGPARVKFGGNWSKFGLFQLNSVPFGRTTERDSRRNSPANRPYAANQFLNSVRPHTQAAHFSFSAASGEFL